VDLPAEIDKSVIYTGKAISVNKEL
jgi:hypothetical protein